MKKKKHFIKSIFCKCYMTMKKATFKGAIMLENES